MSELQIKRRIGAGQVPAGGSLKEGELIVNPVDVKLWVGAVGEDGTTGSAPPVLLNAGSEPTTSEKLLSFTVDEADGMDHHYRVTGAGVVVTIPDTLSAGFRFQVSCMADTTFV